MSDRQARKLYEKYMSIEDDEMAFETHRALDVIGRDGMGVTQSAEAMEFMRDQITMFINTRIMRRWNETGFGPQRVIVTVKVEVQ